MAKRCVLEHKLLLTAYRKSYIRNQLILQISLANAKSRAWQQCVYQLRRPAAKKSTANQRKEHNVDEKAELTLTNPCDAKACGKLLQFDVKTSCRQVNDLFEVMQQPSAPSGEWYWRILLENSLFSPPHTCLMPHSGWTPCDINVTYTFDVIYTPLKSAFNGLQFRRWHYRSIFIRLAVVASQSREITRNFDKMWPYSSSRLSKVIDLGVNRKPMYY